MEYKKIKIANLRKSPIRHTALPNKLIKRIKAFKQILVDVTKTSLEETINDFQRDINPEREIRVWEHVATVYQSFISENSITNPLIKKEVFSIALATSMGMKDFVNINILNKDQIKNIIYRFNLY